MREEAMSCLSACSNHHPSRFGVRERTRTYDERRAEPHEDQGELQRKLFAAAVPNPSEDDSAKRPRKEGGPKDGEGVDQLGLLLGGGEEGGTCMYV